MFKVGDYVIHGSNGACKIEKKVQLTVNVEDREHNMSLFMSSPQMLVEPRQFVKLLESMPEVHDIRINAR